MKKKIDNNIHADTICSWCGERDVALGDGHRCFVMDIFGGKHYWPYKDNEKPNTNNQGEGIG